MAFKLEISFGGKKAAGNDIALSPPSPSHEVSSYTPPDLNKKVYIEKDDEAREWSFDKPDVIEKFYDVLNGYHAQSNLINLFYCLPEVFAPIHEIASRVSDACWQLKKEWNDEIDYKNEKFNSLFQQPNPMLSMKQIVYQAVCYEILTGRQFFYKNKPSALLNSFENVLGLWNLPAQDVRVDMKRIDPYTATNISEFINKYEGPGVNGKREWDVNNVMPIIHYSLEKPFDMNCAKPLIKGAEKAIYNLLAVYEARGAIYIKRGMLGFIVSKKADDSGPKSLTPKEKRDIESDIQRDYGVTGEKKTISVAAAPIEFINTGMSIKDMMPFDETIQDAVAIYKVLRVPRHFVPSKDNSTFSNADSDEKSFYINVIIPWAERYAQIWTNGFYLKNDRRYIYASYNHIALLQEDEQKRSTIDKTKTETAVLQYEKGIIKKNERNAMLGYSSVPDGDKYVTDDTNPDPIAIRLGVGGMQALQTILVDTSLAKEAKKNILIIIFSISPEDAEKLVVEKEQIKTNETNQITPEDTPAANAE